MTVEIHLTKEAHDEPIPYAVSSRGATCFYERMVCSPGVNLVTMLGEASFHQVHGGTTTNVAEPDELVRSYEDQYEELRGRRFYVPLQQAHYVGRLPPAARRIRPRRMNSFQRFRDAHIKATGNRPFRPAPVPQDLKAEFIEAFWRSGEWHRTQWLGKWTHRAPTDLFAYQELICRLRPEWIVETRTGAGGRALLEANRVYHLAIAHTRSQKLKWATSALKAQQEENATLRRLVEELEAKLMRLRSKSSR